MQIPLFIEKPFKFKFPPLAISAVRNQQNILSIVLRELDLYVLILSLCTSFSVQNLYDSLFILYHWSSYINTYSIQAGWVESREPLVKVQGLVQAQALAEVFISLLYLKKEVI